MDADLRRLLIFTPLLGPSSYCEHHVDLCGCVNRHHKCTERGRRMDCIHAGAAKAQVRSQGYPGTQAATTGGQFGVDLWIIVLSQGKTPMKKYT